MKNNIKLSIPDKRSVDIEFKKVLLPYELCKVGTLTDINFDKVFDLKEMSDLGLIEYYNDFSKLDCNDKAYKIGFAGFELYDIKYSYSYDDNKLHLDCTLFYKLLDKLYEGKGKFSVDLSVTFDVPDSMLDDLTICKWSLTMTIADETINVSHHQISEITYKILFSEVDDNIIWSHNMIPSYVKSML